MIRFHFQISIQNTIDAVSTHHISNGLIHDSKWSPKPDTKRLFWHYLSSIAKYNTQLCSHCFQVVRLLRHHLFRIVPFLTSSKFPMEQQQMTRKENNLSIIKCSHVSGLIESIGLLSNTKNVECWMSIKTIFHHIHYTTFCIPILKSNTKPLFSNSYEIPSFRNKISNPYSHIEILQFHWAKCNQRNFYFLTDSPMIELYAIYN